VISPRSSRTISSALLVAIASALLAGCGGGAQQSQRKTAGTGAAEEQASQTEPNSGDCILQFRQKAVQALSLQTNVLIEGVNQNPPLGKCRLILSAQDLVFPPPGEAGNAEYTLTLATLELRRQSRIITNGYRLTIRASEIVSEGGQVIAFDAFRKAHDGTGPGQNGENGLSSGAVEIDATKLTLLNTLSLDLRGQDGGDGAPGGPGVPGVRGTQGSPGISGLGCQQGGGNGSAGGDGARGGRGGNGGKGGNGGNLVLRIKAAFDPSRLIANLTGGMGGRGGGGGNGGQPGQGGEGGSGNGFCGGGQPGPPGRPGAGGDPGTDGPAGVAGQRDSR
jgi:hypothetical protein